MSKNVKRIFFAVTLLTLLVAVSAVSASDVSDDTPIADTVQDNVVSNTQEVASSDAIVTEQVQTTNTDKKPVETKERKIVKKDKTLKTSTRTVEINDFESLMTATYDQLDDTEHDTYIMNINENITTTTEDNNYGLSLTSILNVKTVIFNGNNHTIKTMSSIQPNANHELEINNMTVYLTGRITNRGGTLTIQNSNIIINSSSYAIYLLSGTTIIDDNTQINIINGNVLYRGGTIYTNNTLLIEKLKEAGAIEGENINPIQEGDTQIIKNKTINSSQIYTKDTQLINCNITARITNYGNVTFINCSFSNNDITVLNNNGYVSLVDCIVENNSVATGLINSTGDLNITGTTFTNNTGMIIYVPTTDASRRISVDITNNTFDENSGNNIHLDSPSLNAITNIKENTFTKTSIISKFNQTNIENNQFTNSSLNINNFNNYYNITYNNTIISNTFNDTSVSSDYLLAYNNTFNNGSLTISNNINGHQYGTNYLEAYNNTFNCAYLNLYCAKVTSSGFNQVGEEGSMMNNSVHDNIFQGKINTDNVITLNFPEFNNNTKIYNNTYIHTSINDTINYEIPPKIYVNDMIKFNYQLTNPIFYDNDILDDITYDITIDDMTYNTNTTSNTIQLNTSGEHTIKITPSISKTIFTKSVEVLPLSDVIITPENYNTYIEDGTITKINENDRIIFEGNFTDKGDIVIDTSDIVIDGQNAEFTNTIFTLDASNIVIENMNINNTNTNYAIINTKRNNHILNNNINLTNTDGATAAIKNTAANTIISNNNIYVDGPAKTIDYDSYGIANTQAILIIGANKNTIQNNTITVTTTQPSEEFGTIEAITANRVTNTNITKNTINVSNAKFSYGINMLSEVTDNTITENDITVTSYRYCDGIQVGNQAENILIDSNNINIYCHNTTPVDEEAISYGIITTNMGMGTSTEITITQNTINIDSAVGYGIEIYQTRDTRIHNNTITVTGAYSMGIGFAHSPSSTLTGNNINTIGDSTTPIGHVTEEIQPENVGIKIQQDSTGIKIYDGWSYGYFGTYPNIIHTYDKGKQDYAINVQSENVGIEANYLRCSNGGGNDAIKNYTVGTLNSFIPIVTSIELGMPDVLIVNQTISINISVKDEYGNLPIFAQMGEPIIDDEGYVRDYYLIESQGTLYVTINNITETINMSNSGFTTYNYTPTTLGENTITITFPRQDGYPYGYNTTYKTSKRDGYNESTSTKTFQVEEITLAITPITSTVGKTINITARITAGDETLTEINKGKVTFKVNGKTLKDANGKVIYAKVVNGVATIENYLVPSDWTKEGTTIEAVYSGSTQCEKLTSEKTNITVTPPDAKLTVTPITSDVQTGSTVTFKAKVAIGDKAITTGKIVFKVNGKTVKDANGKVIYAKVDANGEASVDYTIPESFKAGTYNIEAVFTASGYEKLTDNTTMTVVKS